MPSRHMGGIQLQLSCVVRLELAVDSLPSLPGSDHGQIPLYTF